MKVVVIFDFKDITDPNSMSADWVISYLTRMTKDFTSDVPNCEAYIDDAFYEGESK